MREASRDFRWKEKRAATLRPVDFWVRIVIHLVTMILSVCHVSAVDRAAISAQSVVVQLDNVGKCARGVLIVGRDSRHVVESTTI
jgi:hypothetical protein